MRTIFPEEQRNKEEAIASKNSNEFEFNEYMVYNGSNPDGRPWTEMIIYRDRGVTQENKDSKEKSCKCSIFWRIDSDTGGPYISLRFYNKYDKKNTAESTIHVKRYMTYKKMIINNTAREKYWNWDEVDPGNTQKYYEAALIHIHIGEVLQNWNEQGERFVENIRNLTKTFLEAVK